MKQKQIKRNKGATREKQKIDGYFDGRFVEKVETPKPKKKRDKTGTRKKKHKKKIFETD